MEENISVGTKKLSYDDLEWLASQNRVDQAWRKRYEELTREADFDNILAQELHNSICRGQVTREFGGYKPRED